MVPLEREYRLPNNPPKKDLWDSLGLPSRGPELHDALANGLPYEVYTKLVSACGLDSKELARYVVISPATLQRRAKAGRFKEDEGDRLYRFAEVYNSATDLFEGDGIRAMTWLLKPARGLGDRRPIDMVSTTAGAEAVLDLIGRLEHGVVV